MTSFLKGEDTQTKLSHDVFLYLNATLNLISREREGYNAEQTLEALKIETSNFVKEVINDGREFGFFFTLNYFWIMFSPADVVLFLSMLSIWEQHETKWTSVP